MKRIEIRKLKSNSEVRVYINKLYKHLKKSNYRSCIYV